ncbi:MAG: hypothetical protein GY859_32820 [Desulfobacterales bacterium]|nr:hypothetical protein [Desulfobacterales bacterium]
MQGGPGARRRETAEKQLVGSRLDLGVFDSLYSLYSLYWFNSLHSLYPLVDLSEKRPTDVKIPDRSISATTIARGREIVKTGRRGWLGRKPRVGLHLIYKAAKINV